MIHLCVISVLGGSCGPSEDANEGKAGNGTWPASELLQLLQVYLKSSHKESSHFLLHCCTVY